MKQFDYKLSDVMSAAVHVHNMQGFVRSGMGYITLDDDDDETAVKDNRTCIIELINDGWQPSVDIRKTADGILDDISGKLMLKKMTGSLTSFDTNLVRVLGNTDTINNFGISLVASLPHSIDIDKRREEVNDKLSYLKQSSKYLGDKGTRYNLDVVVLDVKFIQSSSVYMITTVYANKDIVKFWWRDQPDISDIIQSKKISIRGTVKHHELSKYTNAEETMLNRVKINGVAS